MPSCSIDYPGATGAVDSSSCLVCCCGTYSGCTGAEHVYGAIISGPPPAKPPGTAVEGSASGGTFHFNGTKICGVWVGPGNRVAVWATGDDDACFSDPAVVDFDGCEYGAEECPGPDHGILWHSCRSCAGEKQPVSPVIQSIAPRAFQLRPDDHLLRFAAAVPGGGGENWDAAGIGGIVLEYDARTSTVERAVWKAPGGNADISLLLEVTRRSHSALRALLSLQLASNGNVEPSIAWASDGFCLNAGGLLSAVGVNGRYLPGALRVAPVVPSQDAKGRVVAKA